MGSFKTTKGSLYVGENQLRDVNEFIKSSNDGETIKNVEKYLRKKNKLYWFQVEGEIYLEVICGKIVVIGPETAQKSAFHTTDNSIVKGGINNPQC